MMSADSLRLRSLAGLFAAGGLFFAASANATVISVLNNDGANEGFNDTTLAAAGTGCQPGDTLGACRLRVFQTAADQWEKLLNSTVEIVVRAQMDPQTCSPTQGVTLGSAGALTAHANFANAPRANRAYPQALANSYAGTDLSAAQPDINATFNISIDAGCSAGTVGWWYDTSPAVPVPDNRIPLLPVVFHEIGHGLGFSALANTGTGAWLTTQVPVWGDYLYDVETAKYWKDMTNAERVASAINDPDLVWTGPRTNKQSVKVLKIAPKVTVNAPAAAAGAYDAQTAEYGANLEFNPVTGDVVLVNDGVLGAGTPAGTANDGCETPFANAAAIAGKIALMDRGFCNFTVKVKNAQLNGAIGAIVANNQPTGLAGMGGVDSTITIPSLGVSQAAGNVMKANPAGLNASLSVPPTGPLSGTQSGCVRMYAPNPLVSGSSVSHFHSDAFQNLLMEPALNRSIFDRVDLTLPLFKDIDWSTNIEDMIFFDGVDPNPCPFVQP